MTVASIPAGSATGYADYLESRTVTPERGDYYLGVDGAPAESPGRWLTPVGVLARVGIGGSPLVAADDLRALIAGRTPGREEWLRPAGADGGRAGGVDLTFSAPKSVSIAWALGDADDRAQIEAAHHAAVAAAVAYVRERAPLTTRYDKDLRRSVPAHARELHAAAFLHTTARGTVGEAPDPQLHSHVVVTSVERTDGTVAAVRSRGLFPAAREGGAYYRAHLADGLRDAGYGIEQAGKDDRYFRLAQVTPTVEQAFSKRTAEVHQAAQAFRAQHGREPARGELRALAVRTRQAKTLTTRGELDGAWRDTARRYGLQRVTPDQHEPAAPRAWEPAVERELTRVRATVDERELRSVALEQAAGSGLRPDDALAAVSELRRTGAVIALEGDRFTTRAIRDRERRIESGIARLASDPGRAVGGLSREAAAAVTAERLGHPLSQEQRDAVHVLTGPSRAAVLVGPAGTGKGVVIDAAARAELLAGREVIGVAVAGRTAQRLGEDSPALTGRTRTVDSLLTAIDRGSPTLSPNTTVYVDEAGMGDTNRLARLVDAVEKSGASLVAVGDHRQLPSVGAGGMFERLTAVAPTAELHEVRRANHPEDRAAWSALRDGDPATAMAHYRARGALRFADDRVAAVDRAATRYTELAHEHGHDQVTLMTDASNAEVDALNLRVQALRAGELGTPLARLRGGHLVHDGDRVVLTKPVLPDEAPRIENGVRATARPAPGGMALVLDGSDRAVPLRREDLAAVRLGYASHVYRQQGATVDHAVVVTGGWQTSRETAYVEASRAREGIEWHVARDELDADSDERRVELLAARMRVSAVQIPSLAYDPAEEGQTREMERVPDVGIDV